MTAGVLRAIRLPTATRTVINGRFLGVPTGGVQRVGRELLQALSEEMTQRGLTLRIRVATPRGRLTEQLLPLAHPGATILSFCNVTPVLAWRSIVWIHDAHVFDSPDTYPRAYRLWHNALLRAAQLRRFQIVTVSNHARDRLIHHGVRSERVQVVYNGGDHILRESPDFSAIRAAGLEGHRYVLLVGSPARHKNVPFALDALLQGLEDGVRIAVLGMAQSGPYRAAAALVLDRRVVVLPKVNDAQLRALYARAAVVVSPSLAEGFGLYAAEAMFAESGPLVLSDRGALPEVGGDAALYFDPTDAQGLAEAVTRALEPGRATQLRAAAAIQRERFRWRRAARQLVDEHLQPVI